MLLVFLYLSANENPTLAPAFPVGSSSEARYFANLAFKRPRWYSVAEITKKNHKDQNHCFILLKDV